MIFQKDFTQIFTQNEYHQKTIRLGVIVGQFALGRIGTLSARSG
jgi:hypothetical protein